MHTTSGRRFLVFGNRMFNNISFWRFSPCLDKLCWKSQILDFFQTNTICTRPLVQPKSKPGYLVNTKLALQLWSGNNTTKPKPHGEIENTFSPLPTGLTNSGE
jgi:hypothetical protein